MEKQELDLMELEQEGDMPANWVTNIILIRNDKGELVEMQIPDDEEE